MVVALLFASLSGYAQQNTYQKSFGGTTAFEYGYATQATSDGGCVIAGCTFSYGGSGCHRYTVKFDADGTEQWSRVYNANQTEVWNDIAVTTDGYVMCGYSYSGTSDTNRAAIVRTNTSGDTLWTKFWPVADAYAIIQTHDGNIVAAGLTASTYPTPSDAFVIKLDGNTGDTLWTRIWGGTQQDWFYGIQETNDGGIVLAGFTASYGAGQNDILLFKTDANGNALWEKTYGTTGQEEAYGHCVQQTTDHGFIVSGYSTTDSAICLVKTDSAGNLQWAKEYVASNTYYSSSHAVAQSSDGGYVIAGWKLIYPSGRNVPCLIKTDSEGNLSWCKFYGGTGDDLFYGVKQATDGGYIACGRNYSFESNGDAYVVKTDAYGNSGCYQTDTVLTVKIPAYATMTITMPLSYGKQTTGKATTVTSGYSERVLCTSTGVEGTEHSTASIANSLEVYPNPFNPTTTITFSLARSGNATVRVYDDLGREVATVASGVFRAGEVHKVQFDGSRLSSGVYYARLETAGKTQMRKLLLIK